MHFNQYFFSAILVMITLSSQAQSVGIGTAPNNFFKLDINGRMRIRKSTNLPAQITMDGASPGVSHTIISTIDENHTGIYGITYGDWLFSADVTNGNVGIGNINPTFKLDLNGQMSILSRSSLFGPPDAGTHFDNSLGTAFAFYGMKEDTFLGIKNNVANTWKYMINTKNNFTGINTANPTATLDINGLTRFRNSIPQLGSVFTSTDVNGHAEWQDLIAFRADGLGIGGDQNIPEATWTKVNFKTTATYNYGLNYQPNNSEFVAGEQGLYNFSFQLSFSPLYLMKKCIARVMQLRNGITTEIATCRNTAKVWNNLPSSDEAYLAPMINYNTGSMLLQAGDKIWIETYVEDVISTTGTNLSSTMLLANVKSTWFSGMMKSRI